MLLEQIKKRMFQAIKAGDVVEKEILRVAVGEIETAAARSSAPATDEAAEGVLRKLVKSNQESLAASGDSAQRATLNREIEILETFLPKSLTVEEIKELLKPVLPALTSAAGDGPAVGIAMKELKKQSANASGKDVAVAVAELRHKA